MRTTRQIPYEHTNIRVDNDLMSLVQIHHTRSFGSVTHLPNLFTILTDGDTGRQVPAFFKLIFRLEENTSYDPYVLERAAITAIREAMVDTPFILPAPRDDAQPKAELPRDRRHSSIDDEFTNFGMVEHLLSKAIQKVSPRNNRYVYDSTKISPNYGLTMQLTDNCWVNIVPDEETAKAGYALTSFDAVFGGQKRTLGLYHSESPISYGYLTQTLGYQAPSELFVDPEMIINEIMSAFYRNFPYAEGLLTLSGK